MKRGRCRSSESKWGVRRERQGVVGLNYAVPAYCSMYQSTRQLGSNNSNGNNNNNNCYALSLSQALRALPHLFYEVQGLLSILI